MKNSVFIFYFLWKLVVVCDCVKILRQPVESLVYEGTQIRLRCSAVGATSGEWKVRTQEKGSFTIPDRGSPDPMPDGMSYDLEDTSGTNYDLLITAQASHMGYYACRIYNTEGNISQSVEVSKRVKLHVLSDGDPIFDVFPKDILIKRGGTGSLSCRLSTRVMPGDITMQWVKIEEVSAGKFTEKVIGTISKTITESSNFGYYGVKEPGKYQCRATHKYNIFTGGMVGFNATVKYVTEN